MRLAVRGQARQEPLAPRGDLRRQAAVLQLREPLREPFVAREQYAAGLAPRNRTATAEIEEPWTRRAAVGGPREARALGRRRVFAQGLSEGRGARAHLELQVRGQALHLGRH